MHNIMFSCVLTYDKYGNFLNFPFLGAIKTYFKILKARQKRATTRIRVEGQIIDKQTKGEVSSRRNQRGHNGSEFSVCISCYMTL